MTSVFDNWTEDMSEAFGKKAVLATHNLHERDMFTDKGLADLLDQYPRDQFNLYTMDDDLTDYESGFRRGVAGDLSGAEILEAVYRGRLWLNLRETNKHLPLYEDLCNEMFGEMEGLVPGLKTHKRDCGVLISSPKARVFYHLDIPNVSLWQIRGSKTLHVYPGGEPYASEEQIEAILLGESEEEITYRPDFESGRASYELTPGKMITWPQMAPHRVDNGDSVNISLSCEFLTMQSVLRANAMYTNGLMRRKLGVDPSIENDGQMSQFAKAALARALKLVRKNPSIDELAPPTFEVCLEEETGVREFTAA